jgi:cystine transport system substrate-binding protein
VGARGTRSAALLAGISATLALAAGAHASGGPAARERALRAQASALASGLSAATLDLYALDSRLDASQARLAALQADASSLRGEEAQLALELASARRTLAVSRRNLSANLLRLYEQGDTDPLAVLLGAESLEQAVSTLDGMKSVADQNIQFVQASAIAQAHLLAIRAQLARQRARIAAALDAAGRTERTLASARASRLAFISRLRTQQRLNASQISALEASVRQAEAKAQELAAAAAASGPVPPIGSGPPAATAVPAPAPDSQPAPVAGGRTLVVLATGYSLSGHTATGLPVSWGVVAVDPTVIPLGTRMTIPGYGEAVAADVGSGVRGATIDLWFPTVAQAVAWGRRTVTITLH